MVLKPIQKKKKRKAEVIEEIVEAVEEEEIEDEIEEEEDDEVEDSPELEAVAEEAVKAEDPWSVQQVAVQTEPVIYNSETKESLTLHEAVVKILNIAERE